VTRFKPLTVSSSRTSASQGYSNSAHINISYYHLLFLQMALQTGGACRHGCHARLLFPMLAACPAS